MIRSLVLNGHLILHLKAIKLVSKGRIYHLVYANDSSVKIQPIQLVSIVSDSSLFFPNDQPGVPPKTEIDFTICIIP